MQLKSPLITGLTFASHNVFKSSRHTFAETHCFIKKGIDLFDEPEPPSGFEYWNDPRIHNFGNVGFGGYIHATVAPYITAIIDNIAYDGRDIRKEMLSKWEGKNVKILDFCCGTGLSTPDGATGVDTSEEMIKRAKKLKGNTDKLFHIGNAEDWGSSYSYDIVTCMFGFHEMPRSARLKIIENCIRITSERVIIVDIDPTYVPSSSMLSGEPYVKDYLKYIDYDMELYNGKKTIVLEGHVARWDFYKTL